MYKTCLALWIAVIAASGPVRAQYVLGSPVRPMTAEPPGTLPEYVPPQPKELPNKPILQAPINEVPVQPSPAVSEFPPSPHDFGPFGPYPYYFPPSYPEPIGYGSHGSFFPALFAPTYSDPATTGDFAPWIQPNWHCPPTYPEPISYSLGSRPPRLPLRTPIPADAKRCEPERKTRCWPWCWTGWSKLVSPFAVTTSAAPIATATGTTTATPAASPMKAPEPLPTREDIARMIADGSYSPAEIAAVKIKLDESQAKGRQAAVQYLATIDCHFYPEAEAGLIAALRADRIESVRFEAAQAMGNCRCMTPRMIDAVRMAAMGMDTDGNPGETSDRVRQAAREALNRCPQCQGGPGPMPPTTTPPQWMPPGPMTIQPTGYWLPPYVPISQEEREIASTVSTSSRPAPKANPVPTRPVVQWFSDLASGRLLRPATPMNGSIDPRLHGLRPLGMDGQLAIPTGTSTSYNR